MPHAWVVNMHAELADDPSPELEFLHIAGMVRHVSEYRRNVLSHYSDKRRLPNETQNGEAAYLAGAHPVNYQVRDTGSMW